MPKYTHSQRINGGKKRAATAKRHPIYGIFLPNVEFLDILCPADYIHGRAGGLKRSQTAKRSNGRFTKS